MNIRQKPFRPPQKLATHQYKTFRVASPLATHFRPATCEEYKCEAFHNGWTYRKADLERENLLYAVTHAGKRYREMVLPSDVIRDPDTGQFIKDADRPDELCLVFEPGQKCFQERMHRVPLDRPEFYFAGRGDYRSFSHRKAQAFTRPVDWVDSFANHLDMIKTEIERG